jgi:tetratricopeptide (TPR) repeat protein
LVIRTEALGPDHPAVADVLYAIGDGLGMKKQHERALASYERALAIFERALGSENPKVAELLDRIGMTTDLQGRPSDGLELVRRALALTEQRKEGETGNGAMYLAHAAFILDHTGRYEEAEGLYQRALAIRQRVLGPQHPDVATNLSNLGRTYLHHRKFKDALDCYRGALAIDEHLAAKPGIAFDLLGLGRVSIELGHPEDAIAPLERAVALVGLRPEQRGSLSFALARALWAAGRDRPRALELAAQAHDDLVSAEGWEFAEMRASLSEWLETHHL